MNDNLSVIGISKSSGTYEGVPFSNVKLHCIRPASNPNEEGQITEVIKIKASLFDSSITVGSFIVPVYNKYGQVQSVELV